MVGLGTSDTPAEATKRPVGVNRDPTKEPVVGFVRGMKADQTSRQEADSRASKLRTFFLDRPAVRGYMYQKRMFRSVEKRIAPARVASLTLARGTGAAAPTSRSTYGKKTLLFVAAEKMMTFVTGKKRFGSSCYWEFMLTFVYRVEKFISSKIKDLARKTDDF
ncbi:MAG: hypothetical protein HC814_08710 [Rhodobacteraceae bacterium]|nr:hypothetical protein [Paracoccaceae bacterium]